MSNYLKLAALLLFCNLNVHAQTAADEKAVINLFERAIDAFHAHDADRYANLFTENADFIAPVGQMAQGREQIRQKHAELFRFLPKPEKSDYAFVYKSVRQLAPDLLLLTAQLKFTDVYAGKSSESQMSFSWVLRRNDAGWLIEMGALTPVQERTMGGK